MDYIAVSKNIKTAPRKIRLVVESVKRNDLKTALSSLSIMGKRGAMPIKKTIDSAIANAVNNFKANKDSLKIKEILVTEGASMKRYHFAARGRVRPYKRRTSHVRVVLTDNETQNKTVQPIVAAETEKTKIVDKNKRKESAKA
jgi:large subunit ribosomal protein L22